MALTLYQPPNTQPLTCTFRTFELPHTGTVRIEQAWRADGGTGTGGAVWDGAVVLAHYLDAHASAGRWANRSLLELGAGLALPSIVASRAGFARVVATDADESALDAAQRNAAHRRVIDH